MIKRGLLICSGMLVLLAVVVLLRTFTYGGPPANVQAVVLVPPPAIDADRAAEHLGQAIRFRTVTVVPGDPRAGEEGPWLDQQAWMVATYPAFHAVAEKETIPGGHSLLYTWTGSDSTLKPLLLMAHQDVVPINIGTEDDWTHGPFSGAVIDGYVYGRGAMDDKGLMVGLFEALETLAGERFQPRRTLLLMLGHDEEVSGSGAQAGVALLKSRGVEPEMALDEGMMVIDRSPLTGKRTAFIGVAEKGYLTLKITAMAEGGHSSTPPRNSATVRLARALIALDENQMPSHLSEPPVSELFAASASDLGFGTKLAFANQWLLGDMIEDQISAITSANAMIRTTTAPTMLTGSAKENVMAQRAVALVNFRVHPRDSAQATIEHVKRVTAEIEGITVEQSEGSGISSGDASPVSPTDNLAYGVLSAVASEISEGAPAVPALVIAATDSRYASAITPNVYRFAPIVVSTDEISGIHGTDEKISVENVGRLVRGYAQIILAMDAGG
jgi:carboxypeptidase PM20D1